jgi:hypothetical protein
MRTLSSVVALDNNRLQCTFDTGETKIADISIYMNAPVFEPIKQSKVFEQVSNKKYFVEWEEYEVDLSADTLWHIGV